MCNAIYQNHLALDYLLAYEGGVCGKFNLSNCCLQTDDEGKITEEITDRMREIANAPVLIWEDRIPLTCLENGSLPWADSNPDGAMGLVLGVCLIVPCLVLLVLWSIRTIMEATIERKTATHVMMLWKYKTLDQGDAL
jgi:hypothetical protein